VDRKPLKSGPWPFGGAIAAGSTLNIHEGIELELSSAATLADGVTINGPGTIRLVAGGSFVAGGNDVTIGDVAIVSDAPRGLLSTVAAGAFTGWLFDRTVFDNVSLRLTAVGRQQNDGSTVSTGTAVHADLMDTEHRNYAQNYAIEVAGMDGVTITRAHIHDNGINIDAGDGIKLDAGSMNTRIIDCTISNNTRDGIDIYDASVTTVDGCAISDSGGPAIDSKWRTDDANPSGSNVITDNIISGNGGGVNAASDNNTVTGNVITSSGDWGVRIGPAINDNVTGSTGGTIGGNTITGHGTGILLGLGTTGVTVDDNTVTGNVINIALAASSATGNTVTNNVAEPTAPPVDSNEIRLTIALNTVSGNTGTVTNV
jgi:parallel beta-helix repeat protein